MVDSLLQHIAPRVYLAAGRRYPFGLGMSSPGMARIERGANKALSRALPSQYFSLRPLSTCFKENPYGETAATRVSELTPGVMLPGLDFRRS